MRVLPSTVSKRRSGLLAARPAAVRQAPSTNCDNAAISVSASSERLSARQTTSLDACHVAPSRIPRLGSPYRVPELAKISRRFTAARQASMMANT
jgi:hypothetical protein